MRAVNNLDIKNITINPQCKERSSIRVNVFVIIAVICQISCTTKVSSINIELQLRHLKLHVRFKKNSLGSLIKIWNPNKKVPKICVMLLSWHPSCSQTSVCISSLFRANSEMCQKDNRQLVTCDDLAWYLMGSSLHILPKYFVLQGICNVSTSKCPWQMQCAVTLHPSPPPSYFVPRAQNARLLGEVPTNSDFGAAKRRRGSMQELRINKWLLAHMVI